VPSLKQEEPAGSVQLAVKLLHAYNRRYPRSGDLDVRVPGTALIEVKRVRYLEGRALDEVDFARVGINGPFALAGRLARRQDDADLCPLGGR
jgi:hypothetical protein